MIIDFRFILIIAATLMLIFISLFESKNSILEGMTYITGFLFFFIGLDIMINGIPQVSDFMKVSSSIVFWGIGITVLIVTSTSSIEKQEW